MKPMRGIHITLPLGKSIYVHGQENSEESIKYFLQHEDCYIIHQGKSVYSAVGLANEGIYHVVPRLVGGKGGFGSMLRTIGAQIEKTTSREACRDLSGRRMRDINNEKKLQEWVGKKAEREREAEEAKAAKRERKRQQPKHYFKDSQYKEAMEAIPNALSDAVDSGLCQSAADSSSANRKRPAATARRTRFSDDDLSSSSSSESEPEQPSTSTSAPPAKKPCLSPSCQPSSSDQSSEPAHPESSAVTNNTVSSTKDQLPTNSVDQSVSEVEDNGHEHADSSQCPNEAIPKEPLVQKDEVSATSEPIEVNLDEASSTADLEGYGLESLKVALQSRGLKCGGTLQERAQRLFSVKGLDLDEIPSALRAKGKGKARK